MRKCSTYVLPLRDLIAEGWMFIVIYPFLYLLYFYTYKYDEPCTCNNVQLQLLIPQLTLTHQSNNKPSHQNGICRQPLISERVLSIFHECSRDHKCKTRLINPPMPATMRKWSGLRHYHSPQPHFQATQLSSMELRCCLSIPHQSWLQGVLFAYIHPNSVSVFILRYLEVVLCYFRSPFSSVFGQYWPFIIWTLQSISPWCGEFLMSLISPKCIRPTLVQFFHSKGDGNCGPLSYWLSRELLEEVTLFSDIRTVHWPMSWIGVLIDHNKSTWSWPWHKAMGH